MVTVGASSILAISTMSASLEVSASVGASPGFSTVAVGGGSYPSSTDARNSTAPVSCCVAPGMASSVAGGGLILSSAATPTVSQMSSSP
jgi:hypothetical protein